MTVPDFQTYMTPFLHLMQDRQERKITDIVQELADYFKLSDDDLEDMIPSGKKSRHVDRVGWAATYLKQAGLLHSPRRAWYQITERGLQVAASGHTVNVDYLRQFPEFVSFQTRTRGDNFVSARIEPSAEIKQTPDEVLETAYQHLRNALASDLLERLKQASPRFFEQVVIDLLLAMGYGGSQRDAARRVGQSGDGGIDGVINEDKLGLDVVYIQAKRWQSPVGVRDVRDFAGSLEERKTMKGIFITTSDFTREAREFVSRIGKRVVLIDGNELAQLLIDYNIGVNSKQTYVIKRIDEDYFSEE